MKGKMKMRRSKKCATGLLSLLALLGTAGCVSPKLPRLATCDGKHLRDVNIYGSVLPGAEPQAPPDTPEAAPTPPPPPPKTGALRDTGKAARLASLRPCGERG